MQKARTLIDRTEFNRRRFAVYFAGGGGAALLPGALAAVAQDADEITPEMVEAAARIAGLELSQDDLKSTAEYLNGRRSPISAYSEIRKLDLPNSVPPAFVFNPLPPAMVVPVEQRPLQTSRVRQPLPDREEDLAFLPVTRLADLIRTRQLSSTDLTRLYLDRLKRYDPRLHCVVTLTETLALEQARQADVEIAGGGYRGPLHGIPYGLKDLFAVQGYRTTFGASPYREQVLDMDATVYQRLREAGAVLVAKLTMGALAQGDRWFGGQTKSPWDPENPDRGSSGSSAGPAAATAAGLVGFAIGTETRGSIISPATRCGATGLRPTFGRVSRHGAMALSWTMDKVGPLCRSAEDCALVLNAINGPDGRDYSLIEAAFNWNAGRDPKELKVAYLKPMLEREIQDDEENPERSRRAREQQQADRAAIEKLRALGIAVRPIELPEFPSRWLNFILSVESAAAFDGLFRSGQYESMLEPPERSSWPPTFRNNRFVPAVEYIQANRARTLLIEQMSELFQDIDLFVGSSLGLTNLTGHPEISLPHGFDSAGQPTSLRMTGKLFGEEEILLLAHTFQQNTDYHRRRPALSQPRAARGPAAVQRGRAKAR